MPIKQGKMKNNDNVKMNAKKGLIGLVTERERESETWSLLNLPMLWEVHFRCGNHDSFFLLHIHYTRPCAPRHPLIRTNT